MSLKEFVWSKLAAKAVKGAVQAALAGIGAARLAAWGVQVDPIALTAALYGALEGLRNWLKHKRGVNFL